MPYRRRCAFRKPIIPVRDAAFLKGSQTPAEAAAEAIADKLAGVKNDAETQYFRYTKEAAQVLTTDEKAREPAETDSRIIGVKLLSFVGEGDIVRIKVAFRVQTALREETPPERKEAWPIPRRSSSWYWSRGVVSRWVMPSGMARRTNSRSIRSASMITISANMKSPRVSGSR